MRSFTNRAEVFQLACLHGWRASLSTLAREAGLAREAVELTLDHIADTEVARAHDCGGRKPERVRLMRRSDEQLAVVPSDPKIIPFRPVGALQTLDPRYRR